MSKTFLTMNIHQIGLVRKTQGHKHKKYADYNRRRRSLTKIEQQRRSRFKLDHRKVFSKYNQCEIEIYPFNNI